MDDTRFKGFAQRVKDGGSKLGGLVQEEDPSMRQRRCPGDERARAATNQCWHGHRVVWGLEWRPRHQRYRGGQQARHRMQRGRDESGVGVEIWKYRRESGGEHRLAGSGLSQKKHVVPTGSGNFQSRNCFRLTTHVGHVCEGRITVTFPLAAHTHPPVERSLHSLSPGPRDQVSQMCEVQDLNAADQTRFLGACRRYYHPANAPRTRREDSRQHSAHRLNTSIQRKLTNEDRVLKSHRRDKARGQSNGRRDREVKSRPRLRNARGGQIHGDALVQDVQAARLERSAHAIACLAHGGVEQADERERHEARPRVCLHVDKVPLDADDAHGIRARKPRPSHCTPRNHMTCAPRARRSTASSMGAGQDSSVRASTVMATTSIRTREAR